MANMQQMLFGSSENLLYYGYVTIQSYDDGGYPQEFITGTVLTRSPTTTIDGGTLAVGFAQDITQIDYMPAAVYTYSSTLTIGGFSSDPGKNYFKYAQYYGYPALYASDSTQYYSAGTSVWSWSGSTTASIFGFWGTTGANFRIVR
jgi:hypothetical protein